MSGIDDGQRTLNAIPRSLSGNPTDPTLEPVPPGQYDDLGELGVGTFGEVHQVFDPRLERTLAMKILRTQHRGSERSFFDEARVTGRLQHPGVVPVHELGVLDDGRPYFTMQQIEGRTLRDLLRAVHVVSRGDGWGTTEDGWGLQRLIEAFQRVCDAVAYAHSRGLLHRDLKPDNVMVGQFGQVLVVDWGLAQRHDAPAASDQVAGTPAYMAPEQAIGEELDPRSDVYGLGAVLYEILSGHSPYAGLTGRQAWSRLLGGTPPEPLGPVVEEGSGAGVSGDRPPIPAGLVAICEQAMDLERDFRFDDAQKLGAALQGWRQGAARRARAAALIDEAAQHGPERDRLRQRASELWRAAKELASSIPPWREEEAKHPLWELEDEAAGLERAAALEDARAEQLLHSALLADPRAVAAHAALAMLYDAQRRRAVGAEDVAMADARLRRHHEALPLRHPVRQAISLEGRPTHVTLRVPPAAQTQLVRFERLHRRLVPVPVRALGQGPIDVSLEPGSWRLDVEAPGCEPVRVPVRAGHDDALELTIELPAAGSLDEVCLVPAGEAMLGGDAEADDSLPARTVWVDGFAIGTFAITNGEYVAFLDDLVDQGRESDALRHAPRERPGQEGEVGALVFQRDDDGHFLLGVDADGDEWLPDAPVVLVDWFGASAYCAWRAERDGLPWRLPSELEWEKAARGVDGRAFPWGEHHDPSWSHMRDSYPRHRLGVVDTFPVDCSPYGVRGLGGLVRDWCLDAYLREGAPCPEGRAGVAVSDDPDARRVERGGAWYGFAKDARAANRFGAHPSSRFHNAGFRICRSVERIP